MSQSCERAMLTKG